MHAEKLLIEGLKVKSVFVLISFCPLWTAGVQTYFFLLSFCSRRWYFYIKQRKGFTANIQAEAKEPGLPVSDMKTGLCYMRCNARYLLP